MKDKGWSLVIKNSLKSHKLDNKNALKNLKKKKISFYRIYVKKNPKKMLN